MGRVDADWTSAQLALQVTAGNYDTERLIEVLGALGKFLGGEKATLRWDGLPSHHSTAMRAWIRTPAVLAGGRAAARLCAGAQPGRGLWSSLKAVELANLTTPTLTEVIQQAHRAIARVRRTPQLASSFLRSPWPVGLMTRQRAPQVRFRWLL